jgi:hypothetical protein
MVLDGAMMILASFALCVLHPGIGFGGSWGDANFHFRKHTELQKGEMSEEGNV